MKEGNFLSKRKKLPAAPITLLLTSSTSMYNLWQFLKYDVTGNWCSSLYQKGLVHALFVRFERSCLSVSKKGRVMQLFQPGHTRLFERSV